MIREDSNSEHTVINNNTIFILLRFSRLMFENYKMLIQ